VNVCSYFFHICRPNQNDKKMKTISRIVLFSLFISCMPLFIYAQAIKVKWGATVSDEKQTKFNIIGADESSVYVLRFQHDKRNMSIPFFVVLDRNTLRETKSVPMQIPVPDDGDAAMNEVYYLQDHFAIMITMTNRKSKLDAAIAYLMDKSGNISPNYKMVLEVKKAKQGNPENRFQFLISPDSTRFMSALYNVDEHYITAAAFDGQLQKLWEANAELGKEIKMRNIVPMAYSMDMDANLLVMLKASSKAIYSNELDNTLVVFDGKSKTLKTYAVTPPDKQKAYETGQFLSDENGHTWFTGMYGEKDTDAKGIAIASYKAGNFRTAFKPFSDKFRTAFMSDSKAAKGGPVDYITIDYVLQNKDNSFIVTMHKYAPRSFVAAAAIKFDHNMNEQWSAPLPIYFWFADQYYSYAPMVTANEVCFIHNDHKKNKEIVDPRECTGLNDLDNSICVLTRVNLATGTVKKDVLPATEETNLIPVRCYQSSEKEMFLFAKRKANVNFGKLTLE
jgi:hypothetical protein